MNKVKLYRLVLLLSIISNLVVGVIIFVSPDSFTSFAGQPNAFPDTWPRHWGAQLWAINFLYLPGYRDPLKHRWPNWMGIVDPPDVRSILLQSGRRLCSDGNLGRRVGPSAALHIFAGCAKRGACFALITSERDVSNTGCSTRRTHRPLSTYRVFHSAMCVARNDRALRQGAAGRSRSAETIAVSLPPISRTVIGSGEPRRDDVCDHAMSQCIRM